jgi:hypothetical protein
MLTKRIFQMPNDQASRFLSFLDPTASAFTFQTVPEPKKTHANLWPQVIHGSLNDLLPKLTDLNKRGAAIYVTVNETDGMGRKTDNIVRVRAIWQDDDDGYKGDFPLKPSIVVSSSPGRFQRYWLTEGLSKEDYVGPMRTMIEKSSPHAWTSGCNGVGSTLGSIRLNNTGQSLNGSLSSMTS